MMTCSNVVDDGDDVTARPSTVPSLLCSPDRALGSTDPRGHVHHLPRADQRYERG